MVSWTNFLTRKTRRNELIVIGFFLLDGGARTVAMAFTITRKEVPADPKTWYLKTFRMLVRDKSGKLHYLDTVEQQLLQLGMYK